MGKNFHILFFAVFFASFVLVYIVFFDISSNMSQRCYDCNLESCDSKEYVQALRDVNYQLCDEVNTTQFCKDFCYYNIVKKSKNISVCEFILSEDLQKICVKNNN